MAARPARAAMAILALAPLLLAACSHPAGGPAMVGLANCGSSPQARPGVLVLVCANNSITARNLKWSAWGKPVAAAIGTAVVDICAYEDCHTGSYRSAPMVVIATGLVRCPGGTSGYTRIQYVFAGTSPFKGVPAAANYANFMVGAHRPGPSSQVVVRPCG